MVQRRALPRRVAGFALAARLESAHAIGVHGPSPWWPPQASVNVTASVEAAQVRAARANPTMPSFHVLEHDRLVQGGERGYRSTYAPARPGLENKRRVRAESLASSGMIQSISTQVRPIRTAVAFTNAPCTIVPIFACCSAGWAVSCPEIHSVDRFS